MTTTMAAKAPHTHGARLQRRESNTYSHPPNVVADLPRRARSIMCCSADSGRGCTPFLGGHGCPFSARTSGAFPRGVRSTASTSCTFT